MSNFLKSPQTWRSKALPGQSKEWSEYTFDEGEAKPIEYMGKPIKIDEDGMVDDQVLYGLRKSKNGTLAENHFTYEGYIPEVEYKFGSNPEDKVNLNNLRLLKKLGINENELRSNTRNKKLLELYIAPS